MAEEEMPPEAVDKLASEISAFRKWYVHDSGVIDRLTGDTISVRDARYDIIASALLGEECDYDFRYALDYMPEGYDMRISHIADKES